MKKITLLVVALFILSCIPAFGQSVSPPVTKWSKITLKPEITVGDTGYLTFSAAVTAIGSTSATLVIPSGNHVADGVTVPANVQLRPVKGAVFTVANGTTFTINGSLDAGPYQIFSCTGTGKAVFGAGAVREVYPEWWSVNTTPGVTDMASAINAALASLPPASGGSLLTTAHSGTLKFGSNNYAATGPLEFWPGTIIDAAGIGATQILNLSTTENLFQAKSGYIGGSVVIRNMTLRGQVAATAGALINFNTASDYNGRNSCVENIYMARGWDGINLGTTTVATVQNVRANTLANDAFVALYGTTGITLQNCYALSCGGKGFNCNIDYSTLISCAADNNVGGGYYFGASSADQASTHLNLISCGAENNTGLQYNFICGRKIGLYNCKAVGNVQFSGTQYVEAPGFGITGTMNIIVDATYGNIPQDINLYGTDPAGGFIGGYDQVVTLISSYKGLKIGNPTSTSPLYLKTVGKTYPGLEYDANSNLAITNQTSGQGVKITEKTQVVNITASGVTTQTLTNFVPYGAQVIGFTVRVLTTIGGATTFAIGDGTSATLWGTGIAVAADTAAGSIFSGTATGPKNYASAGRDIILTATGGNFDGTGQIRLTCNYFSMVAPSE